MKTNFLLGWNDEYLDLRLIAGPFEDSEKNAMIQKEVINMLKKNCQINEEKARNILNAKGGIEVGLNICENGASIIYGSGYTDFIQIVQYDLEPKIIVNTPDGKIFASPTQDEEYPGIATLLDIPGQPGIITEYDPGRGHIVSRVYSASDPDGDPIEIISFKKES